MKKSYLLAMALAAMVSCTSDEFVGDNGSPGQENNNGEKAILFNSNTPRITRSEGATAAQELGYSFNVYATKTVGSTTSNVFAHNPYSDSENTPYGVWYETSSANTTQSNTANWEYVGAAGSKTIPGGTYSLLTAQEIKYWDYAASQYVFTAYSTTGGSVTKMTNNGFTFIGTAAQVAAMYVADKLTITEKSNPAVHTTADNKIGNAVKLTFRSAATKVRLGIYETIPGYEVKNVSFRPNGSIDGFVDATTANAKLSGSFIGNAILSSSSTDELTFTITYDASNVAQLTTTAGSSGYFDFGTFASSSAGIGVTSTAPTWASGSSTYNITLPNTNSVGNMVLYVDYDLVNNTSGETIHVTGAKAVVPSNYMKWNPNYAYTYLFKISDNTNGRTGGEGSPEGLYPITFDAVTIAATGGAEVGTITTLSTPAITTYQAGSVSTEGITYANANGLIYITVNTNGDLATLNAANTAVKLYTVAPETTEADLLLISGYSKTDVTSGGSDALTVQASGQTVNGVTFTANQYATFTPTANTTYAFEYSKDDTYVAATGTYVSGTTYYTDNTGATAVDVTGFEAGVTDVSSYYVLSPAVKAYKVIKVATGSGS